MCGRFAFYSPAEAAAALFRAAGGAAVGPRYNIAPTQDVAAVRDDGNGGRELVSLRWGLIPSWAKNPAIGSRMINARAETVAGKPAYRAAYRRRRCLVLADGFYEWRQGSGGKTPYFISRASGEPFAFAGLWENWRDRERDGNLQTTTIITMPANDFLSQLHDRMPVVLVPETADRWLGGDDGLLDDAAQLMPGMRAWPVSRTVNRPANDGHELIEPAGAELAAS